MGCGPAKLKVKKEALRSSQTRPLPPNLPTGDKKWLSSVAQRGWIVLGFSLVLKPYFLRTKDSLFSLLL